MNNIQQNRQSMKAENAQLEEEFFEAKVRVIEQKEKLGQVLVRVQQVIDSDCSEQARDKFQTSLDHLKVQLSLGAMDTRDAYQDWMKQVHDELYHLEKEMGMAATENQESFQAELGELLDEYVEQAGRFKAELEALNFKFEEKLTKAEAGISDYKHGVKMKVSGYRKEIEQKRKVTADRLDTFESDFSAGASQIKQAVKNLFS